MVVCVLDFIWILTTLDNFTTGHSHSHDHDDPNDDRHSTKRLDDDLLTINHSHHRHHLTVSSVHATIAQPLLASTYPYKQLNAVTKSYHTIDPPTTSAIVSGGTANSSSSGSSDSSGSSASSASQLVHPSSSSSSQRSNTPSPPPTNGNETNNSNNNNNNNNKTVHIAGRIAPAQGQALGQGLDIQSIGNDLDGDDDVNGGEGMGCGSGTLRLPSLSLPPTLSYDPLVTFTTVAQLFGEGHMGNETVPYLATG